MKIIRFKRITTLLKILYLCPLLVGCINDIEINQKRYLGETTLLDSSVICYNYDLVFSDEFSNDKLDTSKWFTYFPYGYTETDSCEYCRTHGNEGQIYLDKNVKVENGLLYLNVYEEDCKWYNQERSYTSGIIHSRNKYKFLFGKFEIRAKIPEGMGFWPAFWMYGKDATEVDIFEFGCQNTENVFTNIHFERDSIHYSDIECFISDNRLSEDFHTYTLVLTPNKLTIHIDGILIREFTKFSDLSGKRIDCLPYIQPGIFIQNVLFPKNVMNIIIESSIKRVVCHRFHRFS